MVGDKPKQNFSVLASCPKEIADLSARIALLERSNDELYNIARELVKVQAVIATSMESQGEQAERIVGLLERDAKRLQCLETAINRLRQQRSAER